MDNMNVNISAPNLVAVCIDTKGESGRLYHRYMEGPVVFRQFTELILKLEELYDRIGYPQAALEFRRFGKDNDDVIRKIPMEPVVSPDKLIARRGELATFFIHVKGRQLATWQGEAFWAEQNRKEFFESELDLLKILDLANR